MLSTKKNKYNFTEREIEVLKLLTKTYSNTEIAQKLIISPHTAKAHVSAILHKMGVQDRIKAIVKAIEEKLV